MSTKTKLTPAEMHLDYVLDIKELRTKLDINKELLKKYNKNFNQCKFYETAKKALLKDYISDIEKSIDSLENELNFCPRVAECTKQLKNLTLNKKYEVCSVYTSYDKNLLPFISHVLIKNDIGKYVKYSTKGLEIY